MWHHMYNNMWYLLHIIIIYFTFIYFYFLSYLDFCCFPYLSILVCVSSLFAFTFSSSEAWVFILSLIITQCATRKGLRGKGRVKGTEGTPFRQQPLPSRLPNPGTQVCTWRVTAVSASMVQPALMSKSPIPHLLSFGLLYVLNCCLSFRCLQDKLLLVPSGPVCNWWPPTLGCLYHPTTF